MPRASHLCAGQRLVLTKEPSAIWAALWLFTLIVLAPSVCLASAASWKLGMPDGQLSSRLVQVRVENGKLEPLKDNVRLCLYSPSSRRESLRIQCSRKTGIGPFQVTDNQVWIAKVAGVEQSHSGSVLLFDLSSHDFDWWKPGERLIPALYWKDGTAKSDKKLISLQPVYLSQPSGVIAWAVISVALVVGLIWVLTGRRNGLLLLLTTRDGKLSMSLTQMALWTVAIGGAVIAFGLSRLEVPNIPGSLLLLMGFSSATGAAGHWQANRLQTKTAESDRAEPSFGDLIRIPVEIPIRETTPPVRDATEGETTAEGEPSKQPGAGDDENSKGDSPDGDATAGNPAVGVQYATSLAKAQVLFWTLFTLALFFVKSATEGELWAIPENIVALMGISQAGFLGRKAMAPSDASPAPTTT